MICTYLKRSHKDWVCDIRKEIEDVLQLVGDLVVHRQLPGNHLGKPNWVNN